MPIDLLSDPVISTRDGRRLARRSLPGVLAALTRDEVESFPALPAHHAHAWHCLLVQLAVLACAAAGRGSLPETEADWRGLLAGLAGGADTAFHLTASADRPAFLQAATRDTLDDFDTADCPDELDVAVTARSHVVKRRRMADADSEDWLFALVALQTVSKMAGRGHYPIARMAGSHGSRLVVTLAPSTRPGPQVRRDAAALLAARRDAAPGKALLWLEPWDGAAEEMLSTQGLDPLFIEICRRVRLVERDGRLAARIKGSAAPRLIAAKKESGVRGNLGCPWTPINAETQAAATPPEEGLTYDFLARVLFDESRFRPALLQRVQPGDGPELSVVVRAILGGQGKAAWAERVLPVPRPARALLSNSGGRSKAGEIAREMLQDVRFVRARVLRPALVSHLQDGARRLDPHRACDRAPTHRAGADLDRALEDVFFDRLMARLDPDGDPAAGRKAWLSDLIACARGALSAAIARDPKTGVREMKASAVAWGRFEAAARRTLQDERTPTHA